MFRELDLISGIEMSCGQMHFVFCVVLVAVLQRMVEGRLLPVESGPAGVTDIPADALKLSEVLRNLASNDQQGCLGRLLCEIGAKPRNYPEFGRHLVSLLMEMEDEVRHPAVKWYKNAFYLGYTLKRIPVCVNQFSSCSMTSLQLQRAFRFSADY